MVKIRVMCLCYYLRLKSNIMVSVIWFRVTITVRGKVYIMVSIKIRVSILIK